VAFPKLSPFGEAFRRNGYKFPGKDEEFAKQEQVPLGDESYREVFPRAVWPGVLAASAPLALGFNGFAAVHPGAFVGHRYSSSGARADNGAAVAYGNLVQEAHLWAGGTFSEHIAYFSELTVADGGAEIERAELHFNDLGRSPHLFNLFVGRGVPNLTSFAPHSSYIADGLLPAIGVTALYGGVTDSFQVAGQYNLVELNGMYRGRFIYSLAANSGANLDSRTTNNATAHLGFKAGGMRLDGEGDTTGDPQRPWAESALTLDLFGYRSVSRFTNALDPTMPVDRDDRAYVLGAHARATLGSFELNSGLFREWHDHASASAAGVKVLVKYDELSYIFLPWLVFAARAEYVRLAPDGGSGASDLRFLLGAVCLVRANLKVTVTGYVEQGGAAPDAGWAADDGGRVLVPGAVSVTELEAIQVGVAYAF
jgi:hypothetical protein